MCTDETGLRRRALEHLKAADRILAEASANSPHLTIKAVNAAWLEMNKARALLLDEAYQAAAARLRLRDAAPDMLAAAKALIARDTAENWNALREAVAKAEGR